MKRDYIVYCYKSPSNKRYIGITKNGKYQRSGGINGKGYVESRRFYNAIKKYGFGSFDYTILARNLTVQEANKLEQFFIAYYNTMNEDYGYNLQSGGLVRVVTDETKQLIKLNHANCSKENNSFWGRQHSEATRKLISQNHNYEKQSGIYNNKSKQVICFETEQIFSSARNCALYFDTNQNMIAMKCHSLTTCYKGKHFMYYKDFITLYETQPHIIEQYLHNTKYVRQEHKQNCIYKSLSEYMALFTQLYENKYFTKNEL